MKLYLLQRVFYESNPNIRAIRDPSRSDRSVTHDPKFKPFKLSRSFRSPHTLSCFEKAHIYPWCVTGRNDIKTDRNPLQNTCGIYLNIPFVNIIICVILSICSKQTFSQRRASSNVIAYVYFFRVFGVRVVVAVWFDLRSELDVSENYARIDEFMILKVRNRWRDSFISVVIRNNFANPSHVLILINSSMGKNKLGVPER